MLFVSFPFVPRLRYPTDVGGQRGELQSPSAISTEVLFFSDSTSGALLAIIHGFAKFLFVPFFVVFLVIVSPGVVVFILFRFFLLELLYVLGAGIVLLFLCGFR